jgi:hypothetical protein
MVETKTKTADSLRTPKPKKKLGLSVPPALRMPHEDLIHAEEERKPTLPSHTSMTRQSSRSSQTSPHQSFESESPISPTRDYAKVANSIVRDAIPAGYFTGKSKQLYDCLYSLTRGAVTPSRTVRISRPTLMRKAKIGARVTFDANIERLEAVGLIRVRRIAGEHEGNEYTVFVPGETTMTSQTTMTSHSSLTDTAEKLDGLVGLETSQTSHSISVANTDTSGETKTSFKTNTEQSDDDEAFARLRLAMKEATGREITTSALVELDELLAIEFKIAASRTTVSSAPAFLAEHLRRRLFKKDKRQIEKESAEPQSDPSAAVDKKKCPDCGGSGYFYPEGYDKGVARCDHKKLQEDVTQ